MPEFEKDIKISQEEDIIAARGEIRRVIIEHMNFSLTDRMQIVTAVSELARNIIKFAGKGIIRISIVKSAEGKQGIKLIFQDQGPGIPDIEEAMKPREVYQYQKGMGLGLSGSKKLADEFSIKTAVGQGTVVTWIKWVR